MAETAIRKEVIQSFSIPERVFYDTYIAFKNGTDKYLCNEIGYDNQFYLLPQIPLTFDKIKMVVDYLQPETKIAIELDGFEYHKSKQQFTKDRLKSNLLQRKGYLALRFPACIVLKEPQDCLVEIYRAYCERVVR